MVDRKGMETATKEASLENAANNKKSDVEGVAASQSSFHEKAEKGKDIKIVKGLVGDKMGTPASPLELFARKCQGMVSYHDG
jgi:hypothetical protein